MIFPPVISPYLVTSQMFERSTWTLEVNFECRVRRLTFLLATWRNITNKESCSSISITASLVRWSQKAESRRRLGSSLFCIHRHVHIRIAFTSMYFFCRWWLVCDLHWEEPVKLLFNVSITFDFYTDVCVITRHTSKARAVKTILLSWTSHEPSIKLTFDQSRTHKNTAHYVSYVIATSRVDLFLSHCHFV